MRVKATLEINKLHVIQYTKLREKQTHRIDV